MREIINEMESIFQRVEVIDVEIGLIRPFRDHPFRVTDDERMKDLIDSIARQGILTPLILRPMDDGYYELLSGHRRLHAAEKTGLIKVPARIVDVTDDEATIIMVDTNLQREELLPSERAFSLKMKMDALRHQGSCRHSGDNLTRAQRKTAAIVGAGSGMAARSVHRYISLTNLLPELLEMVDRKELSLVNGSDIASFNKEIQGWLLKYITEHGGIRPEQMKAIKEQENLDNLTQYTLIAIMRNALAEIPKSKKVSFSEKRLNKYFPEEYSAHKRETIIIELLQKWKEEQERR